MPTTFRQTVVFPNVTGRTLELVPGRSDVPDAASTRVNSRGWTKMYWQPWRAYLAARPRAAARKRS